MGWCSSVWRCDRCSVVRCSCRRRCDRSGEECSGQWSLEGVYLCGGGGYFGNGGIRVVGRSHDDRVEL